MIRTRSGDGPTTTFLRNVSKLNLKTFWSFWLSFVRCVFHKDHWSFWFIQKWYKYSLLVFNFWRLWGAKIVLLQLLLPFILTCVWMIENEMFFFSGVGRKEFFSEATVEVCFIAYPLFYSLLGVFDEQPWCSILACEKSKGPHVCVVNNEFCWCPQVRLCPSNLINRVSVLRNLVLFDKFVTKTLQLVSARSKMHLLVSLIEGVFHFCRFTANLK